MLQALRHLWMYTCVGLHPLLGMLVLRIHFLPWLHPLLPFSLAFWIWTVEGGPWRLFVSSCICYVYCRLWWVFLSTVSSFCEARYPPSPFGRHFWRFRWLLELNWLFHIHMYWYVGVFLSSFLWFLCHLWNYPQTFCLPRQMQTKQVSNHSMQSCPLLISTRRRGAYQSPSCVWRCVVVHLLDLVPNTFASCQIPIPLRFPRLQETLWSGVAEKKLEGDIQYPSCCKFSIYWWSRVGGERKTRHILSTTTIRRSCLWNL